MFLTGEIISKIVDFSNEYASIHILHKQYYAAEDGSWREIVADEIRILIGLLLYMGLVPVKNYEKYWSRSSLFHVLWARAYFNSRDYFKAILTFLHVDDPDNDPADRMHKIRLIYEQIRDASQRYYQPHQHVSLDERIARIKGRHAMKVYWKVKNLLETPTRPFHVLTAIPSLTHLLKLLPPHPKRYIDILRPWMITNLLEMMVSPRDC